MSQDPLAEKLRAQLDTLTYQQLALAIRAQKQASDQAGYLRALNDRGRALRVVDTLRGMVNSWTAWVATALVALPGLMPTLQSDLPALLGPDAAGRVMQVCGVLMLLLRLKTTSPLAEKVAVPAPGDQR